MASPKLPVSRLINVALQLTPNGAQAQSLSTLLLASTNLALDTIERYRMYESLAAVALDFGTTDPVYFAALSWFSQQPTPRKLMVGRWARSATPGGLRCAPTPFTVVATWQSITSGGFTYSVDGGGAQNILALNFAAVTDMDGVAAVITAALTGAVCKWEASFSRFSFRSLTTGPTSAISFLTAPPSGTNIADDLQGRSTDSGAYLYTGITAESASAWLTLFDSQWGQLWYGVGAAPSTALLDDHALLFASTMDGLLNKHMLFLNSTDAACLLPSSTTDLMYLLKAGGYRRTFTQYTSDPHPYAAFSAAARLLGVNYNGNNTTLSLMYKQEPGVVAEVLNTTQVGALEAKNGNVFVAYDNDTNILQQGKMADGTFADVVAGTDWLAVTIQNALYNVLYTSTTKIPQTDAGVHLLVTTAEAICSQGVFNGLLAPGVWNSQGFGILQQGGYVEKGFYVYASSVDTQTQADRAARKSPPIQIAAKLAGAIHTVDTLITVNQ